jgi:hypothetical protein
MPEKKVRFGLPGESALQHLSRYHSSTRLSPAERLRAKVPSGFASNVLRADNFSTPLEKVG